MFVSVYSIFRTIILFTLFCCCVSFSFGQDEKNPPTTDKPVEKSADDGVIKVDTALIQTGVQVFDKKGRFVDNLEQSDFELSVDGNPILVSFFERNASEKNSDSQPNNNQNNQKSIQPLAALTKSPTGRNIIFVVDDFHLSFDSNSRIHKLIMKFIEKEMLPEDTVAIVSPSGKIGFLQQFTNDKTVLEMAVKRLIFTRDRSAIDRVPPPMTEYEALLINQYDKDVTDFFAAQEFGTDMDSKRETVRTRARTILSQAAVINRGTYSTLEQTVRNAAPLPGRKIVFFISDGFLLDRTNTDSSYLLQRIYDAAARTNTVIYSFDAKGLEAGFPEGGATASSQVLGYRVQSGERLEKQDGLSLLADKTGGQFIRNTNDLQNGLTNSIREASQFYLLAWEPADEKSKEEKFRKIEVRIKNHPELRVKVQDGYLVEKTKTGEKQKKKNTDQQNEKNQIALSVPERQLDSAVKALFPAHLLPTALTVNYVDVINEGALLAATMQINSDAVEFTTQNDQATASVDIVGIIYNVEGKREGYFRQLVSVNTPAANLMRNNRPNISYNYQTKLKPGLYQVRVASRDVKSGRVGSAVQWIKIPDLSDRKLTIGSLILSEQNIEKDKNSQENSSVKIGLTQLPVSVERRFTRSSRIRYLLFIYNAAQKPQPDLTIQIQILRDGNIITESAPTPISVEGKDFAQLPFAAEIPLASFLSGRYELQITVRDRISKNEAMKRIDFQVQ